MSATTHDLPKPSPTWRDICEMAERGSFAGFHVETDVQGRLLLTPVNPVHGALQATVSAFLKQHLAHGVVVVEVAVSTAQGMKVPDVAWYSRARFEQRRDSYDSPLAPEICVEVLSPSNEAEEMAEKRVLYFAQGAEEVWLCSAEGQLEFWIADDPAPRGRSTRCPDFPDRISI